MESKIQIPKGGYYIILYVITSAISNVFVNHTTRSIHPIVTLFYTSVFTIAFFSILNFNELSKNIVLIKENKKSILWLNFLNATIWFVIFFSLKVLNPSVFSCLFLGAIPIHIFAFELRKSKETSKRKFVIALFLLIMFALMISLVFQEVNETNAFSTLKYGALVTIV